jgi:hypothetical protein
MTRSSPQRNNKREQDLNVDRGGGKIPLERGAYVVHPTPNVCAVHFEHVNAGWEQWILLTSDRHHDSMWCDRALEAQHLDQMAARGGYCVDVGDLFDMMQGKFDPRRTYSDLRPEYKTNTYLDDIVKDAAQFYGPYAKRILMMGRGNHDQSIVKHNSTDPLANLVHRLNSDHGGRIQPGGYGGWVVFKFHVNTTTRKSVRLKYFHGSGGGGPVTRGVIQTNRQAVFLPDADIVVNGHTHDSWHVPIARERLSDQDVVSQDIQHHVRTSTYKNEYRDGAAGWHVETGKPPKPIGAVWLHFYYVRNGIGFDFVQDVR